jgi:predicted PurR-regulated permease PerM
MLQFNGSNILMMVAMLLALLFALFVYYKDSRFKDASTFTRLLLVFLRFVSLAIILLFLFNPKWVKTIKRTDKPILVFLQDASSSIKNYKDSLFYQTNFLEMVEKNNQLLEENYEVYEYNFVDSIYAGLNNKSSLTTEILLVLF